MTPDDILKNSAASQWVRSSLSAALARDPVDAVSDAVVLLYALRHRLRDELGERHPEELEPRIGPYHRCDSHEKVLMSSKMVAFCIAGAAIIVTLLVTGATRELKERKRSACPSYFNKRDRR
jgi:hypothetical protein